MVAGIKIALKTNNVSSFLHIWFESVDFINAFFAIIQLSYKLKLTIQFPSDAPRLLNAICPFRPSQNDFGGGGHAK
jgi:hypothetical protein